MKKEITTYLINFRNCISMSFIIFFVTPLSTLRSIIKILAIMLLYYFVMLLYLFNSIANSRKIENIIIELLELNSSNDKEKQWMR